VSSTPISDHALLSDCHSAALVDNLGSVEWWCAPRFDSPSVFGRILDGNAGYFSVTVSNARQAQRRYLDGTLIAETTIRAEHGVLVLTDGLAMAEGVRGHDLGKGSPHRLLRRARCESGELELAVEFVPRFEYGLTTPLLEGIEGGILARGGPVTLVLSTTAQLEMDDGRARGTAFLTAGEDLFFAVEYGSSWEEAPGTLVPDRIMEMLEDTAEAWRSWGGEHQRYDGPFAAEVDLAGRILQGLTYVPTGAIIAAPSTSLPETIGGSRNWDYRYSWVRDASLTLDALWVAACPDEEQHFFRYLTTAASSVHHQGHIQIMFGIAGERDLAERELPWLEGWRSSGPVRVGNAAWNQRQNDVYGELIAAAHRLRHQLSWEDTNQRRLLITLADQAARVWSEPDHGIWEIRGQPRHYLYSKLMCWVALDRAIDMADLLDAGARLSAWEETRTEISEAILGEGWNSEAGAFTQSFGSTTIDASSLVIPIVGFISVEDPRMVSTVAAVEGELMDDSGLVLRYRDPDGIQEEDGAFLLCSFWLAQIHALADRVDRAREIFAKAASFANDVGLMSEEVDFASGSLIGNFPQAFSHTGLVNAAWAINEAERRAASD
jgi:alpha,alpha-trehalase